MSTAPSANSKAIPSHPKTEENVASTQDTTMTETIPESAPVNWDSELQLVSSLAKLQELESKIHELRTFLPSGLLDPLVPISSSGSVSSNPVAESPPILRSDLGQSIRDSLESVKQFQSMWRGPEMQAVWAHTESRMKEANGQLIQPTGVWEKDYDVILAELTKGEKVKEDERLREEEEAERTKALSAEGGWPAVIDRFIQRGVPGIRVIKSQTQTSLAVALARAGMVFLVEDPKDSDSGSGPEWKVSCKTVQGRPPAKLEQAILDCLNSRPRKWDLAFLLDMIASYANIKQTPCIKCTRLANNAAQLPTIRRAQSTQPSNPDTESKDRVFVFDAFHPSCA